MKSSGILIHPGRSWADFDLGSFHPQDLRRDTRLYRKAGTFTQMQDEKCIGSILMENPGDLVSISTSGWQPFVDSTMRKLYRLFDAILATASTLGKQVSDDSYIEILNLYYFCNSTSFASLPAWLKHSLAGKLPHSQSPRPTSKFILVACGQEPYNHPTLRMGIAAISSFSIPCFAVDPTGIVVKGLSTHPGWYPVHPNRFFTFVGGEKAIHSAIAKSLAPLLSP